MEIAVVIPAVIVGVALVGRFIERAANHRRMNLIASGVDDGDDADQYGSLFTFADVQLQHGTSFDYVDRPATNDSNNAMVRVEVPFIEGRFEPGQSVDARVRGFFDRLDGYAVHRFDTRIRISGTAAPYGSVPVPERGAETVAALVRCYTGDADAVIAWVLAREANASGDDRAWWGDRIVATLGREPAVIVRANDRVARTRDAAEVVRWAPIATVPVAEALRDIAGSQVHDDVRARAVELLVAGNGPAAADWAAEHLRAVLSTGGAVPSKTVRAMVDVIAAQGEASAVRPLMDATTSIARTPMPGIGLGWFVRATRELVERVGDALPDDDRAAFAADMRGLWWQLLRDDHVHEAIDILGMARTPELTAFLIAEMRDAERHDIEVLVRGLGRWGDLGAVAPLMKLADGWSGRGGLRRVAEQAIAQIQDRCAKGAAGGLAVSSDEGNLTVVAGADAGGLSAVDPSA